MLFTIVRRLDVLPSYVLLYKLAEQNHVRVTGNEHTGSFASRGVDGDYEFNEDGVHGRFAGHQVTGQFSIENGKAAVSVIEKPFWLPEMLLKRKIGEGLDTLSHELTFGEQALRSPQERGLQIAETAPPPGPPMAD